MSQLLFVKTLKKFIACTLITSLLLNPIAFATSSSLELDFKESDTADRLHTMMPLSKVRDISHLEIDVDQQRVSVHKHNGTTDHDLDAETLSFVPRTSVLSLPQENVCNLPWHLGEQGLKSFFSQHTACLIPLSEGDYKLEFKGRLLGGGSDNEGDSGGNDDYGSSGGDYGGGNAITTTSGASVTTSSGDSVGYSNDYGGGSYSSSSGGDYGSGSSNTRGCPSIGVALLNDPVMSYSGNLCDRNDVFYENNRDFCESSGCAYGGQAPTTSHDTGRSYGKNSDGGSSNNSNDNNSSSTTTANSESKPSTDQSAAASAPQFNLESFTKLFNNVGANQPASQPTPNDFVEAFNNLFPNQPATPAPQPTPNDFVKAFNNLFPNQPATPAPQPTPNDFVEEFNNLLAPQPAQPAQQPAPDPFAEEFNNLLAPQPANPAPAPVAEQPVNPAPVPAPVLEQPDQPLVQQVNFRGFDPNLLNQGGRVGGTGMSGGGGKPNLNSAVGTKNQPSASQPARIVNLPKAESSVWKDLKPYRGQYKTDAKREKFYEWDHTHNEIEVYTPKGKHLGAMDPKTGKMIKPAEIGRTIQL